MNINDIKDGLAKWQRSLMLSGECKLLKNLVITPEICDFYKIKDESRLLVAYMGYKRFDDTYFYLMALEDQGCILFESEYAPEEIKWGKEGYNEFTMTSGLVSLTRKVPAKTKFTITWENGHPQAKNSQGQIYELADLPNEEPTEEVLEELVTGDLYFDFKNMMFGKQNIVIISEQDMEAALVFLYDDGHVVYFGEYEADPESHRKYKEIIASCGDNAEEMQKCIAVMN